VTDFDSESVGSVSSEQIKYPVLGRNISDEFFAFDNLSIGQARGRS
jgi:hypothetical protein